MSDLISKQAEIDMLNMLCKGTVCYLKTDIEAINFFHDGWDSGILLNEN